MLQKTEETKIEKQSPLSSTQTIKQTPQKTKKKHVDHHDGGGYVRGRHLLCCDDDRWFILRVVGVHIPGAVLVALWDGKRTRNAATGEEVCFFFILEKRERVRGRRGRAWFFSRRKKKLKNHCVVDHPHAKKKLETLCGFEKKNNWPGGSSGVALSFFFCFHSF